MPKHTPWLAVIFQINIRWSWLNGLVKLQGMEYESEFDEDRRRCILLMDFIISSMSKDVKFKIALEGYTPLQIATVYILDQIKYLEIKQGSVTADNVLHAYESFHFLFVFDQPGNKIVDIIF